MATDEIIVENRGREAIEFAPVYRTETGRAPIIGKCQACADAGEPCEKHAVETFVLRLGSQDDAGGAEDGSDVAVLLPTQSVPEWALHALRKRSKFFQHLVSKSQILVRRAA